MVYLQRHIVGFIEEIKDSVDSNQTRFQLVYRPPKSHRNSEKGNRRLRQRLCFIGDGRISLGKL